MCNSETYSGVCILRLWSEWELELELELEIRSYYIVTSDQYKRKI